MSVYVRLCLWCVCVCFSLCMHACVCECLCVCAKGFSVKVMISTLSCFTALFSPEVRVLNRGEGGGGGWVGRLLPFWTRSEEGPNIILHQS